MFRKLIGIAALAVLAGCATAPKPLQGEFSPISPDQARSETGVGEQVRWGGKIVSVQPMERETCLEILSSELNRSARPVEADTAHQGRFIACKPGFLDPAAFESGREVTVVGSIDRVETRKIGEYDYRYPMLDAETVYLWPERKNYARYAHRPYYYDPFFYGPFYWPYPYRYSIWYRHHGFWPKAGSATSGPDSG